MNLNMKNDYLLVRELEAAMSEGGILLPTTHGDFHDKDRTISAEVIAAGPGRRNESGALNAMDVAKGDRITLKTFDCMPVRFNGQDYFMAQEDDVLLVHDKETVQ